jgi:hypothetical protein
MPINEDVVKYEILQGLSQIDDTFIISDFYMTFDKEKRTLSCSFTATTATGEKVSEVISYA